MLNFRNLSVAAVAICVFLPGCAGHPRRSTVAAPALRTERVKASVTTAASQGREARTMTETVIKTVDRLITVADPRLKEDLTSVRAELFRVTVLLRDQELALNNAQEQIVEITTQAVTLENWGIAQQTLANANADGWVAEEKKNVRLAALESRVNKLWGGGAIVYGLERLLTAGIWGLLILAVAFVALSLLCPLAWQSAIALGRGLWAMRRSSKPQS